MRPSRKPAAPVPANYYQPFILTGHEAFRYVTAPAAERRAIRERVEREARAAHATTAAVAHTAPHQTEDVHERLSKTHSVRVYLEVIETLDLCAIADQCGIAYGSGVQTNTSFRGTIGALQEMADLLVFIETEETNSPAVIKAARLLRVRIDRITGDKS